MNQQPNPMSQKGSMMTEQFYADVLTLIKSALAQHNFNMGQKAYSILEEEQPMGEAQVNTDYRISLCVNGHPASTTVRPAGSFKTKAATRADFIKSLIAHAANDIHRIQIEISRQYDPRVVLPHTDNPVKADVVVKDVTEFERYINEDPTKPHDDSDYGANTGGLIP